VLLGLQFATEDAEFDGTMKSEWKAGMAYSKELDASDLMLRCIGVSDL